MNRLTILLFFVIFSITLLAQNKKILNIQRTDTAPKIDGVLDDLAWKNAEIASDFTQFRPEMGVKEKEHQKTIVKITYNDEAIFVSAYLHDKPEDIVKQFTSRDNFGISDYFGVIFNPNNDAQNDTEFFVFSSGTQADAVSTSDGDEDFGWNAVWESAVKTVEDGWVIEMKIPYSALRFSNESIQTWGLQFHRRFRADNSQFSWNPIDRSVGSTGLYHGELTGIKNIKPPTRLSFYPFASAAIKTFDGKTEDDYSVGMDVKYGISENFTLDATLIPDFSQAAFDDVELNLGPFEQRFSEQRQFFKEGVDLFNKGNLFYSRRIGNAPTGEATLNSNETLSSSPEKVKMLNAIKISGRTKNGLGIGFFNAITEKTSASIKNNDTKKTREEVVEPLANYNVFVLDQQFNKNSSVSLINTNVTRDGHFRDANVTGLLTTLINKKNTYGIKAEAKISSINLDGGSQNGFSSEIAIGKVAGNYQYSIEHNLADKEYDINDLGIQRRNNYNNFSADFSYQIFEPTEKLNSFRINTWINYKRLHNPNTYTGFNIGSRISMTTKKLISFGGRINAEIGNQHDYFESRSGKVFIYKNWVSSSVWLSTDYNKKIAINSSLGIGTQFEEGRDVFNYEFRIAPRFKFNDNFNLIYELEYNNLKGNRGFVTDLNNDIVFGERKQNIIENSISGSYNFNPLHSLNLTFRNYWSTVTYDNELFTLLDNGKLTKAKGYTIADVDDPNVNFNTWNLDFSYSWQFAPGSQLTALYRNRLLTQTNTSQDSYFNSLDNLFEQPLEHIFSLRMVYYIDYNNLKKII